MSKLSFSLLKTNVQNNKYYGHSAEHPCCNLKQEKVTHMLSCNSPSTFDYQNSQLELLETRLSKLGIPDTILDAIIHGLTMWEQRQHNSVVH
jgi:hypothetical protein